ncbi:DUF3943 domain-containing protein [Marinospirillum insulare]|uniref:DUF3943 domain-containing protein n=1 Tax=Marinospirillum insulare TaxID=217169 RepID=A0ABQ5ZYG9_9GAMM|nr:DUF3943 domain-containing protein [Marinospirillum insulare]GLR63706.1 hypothetical protein GCM10007878_11410 [Marinospirillum insulare]
MAHTNYQSTQLTDQHTPLLNCHSLACQYWLANPNPVQSVAETPDLAARSNTEKYTSMLKETRNMGILSLGIMGLLYVMPESVSKWDKDEMKFNTLGKKWKENISDGPIWDQDEWGINYIGHPYFGAAYYMVARNQGLGPLESGAYSFLMSSFLWEMGIEAFAEVPSKQDLIITPLIGSVIGEAFFIWEKRIEANHSQVMGSTFLGKTTLVLLNPAGTASAGINRLLNGGSSEAAGLQGGWVIQAPRSGFIPGEGQVIEPGWVGLEMKYGF